MKTLVKKFWNGLASIMKVNSSKSEFYKKSLEFLGHVLEQSGIFPSLGLTRAYVDVPTQENVV